MTTGHDIKKGRSGRRFLWRFLVFIGGLALFVLVVWFARKPIAGFALSNWCAGKELECSAQFSTLNTDLVVIEGLSVEHNGETPIAADRLELALFWRGSLRPHVSQVRVERPVLRGELRHGEPGLFGLEDVIADMADQSAASAEPMALPITEIRDGKLVLETDAGTVSGSFEAGLDDTQSATLSVLVDPAELEADGARLSWSRGTLSLLLADGVLSGEVDVSLETAQMQNLTLSEVDLRGHLAERDGLIAYDLFGGAERFAAPDRAASGIVVKLAGTLDRADGFAPETLAAAMQTLALQASGDQLAVDGLEAGRTEVSLDLSRDGGVISGPVAIDVRDVAAEAGASKSLMATGDIIMETGDKPAYRFDGAIVSRGTGLAPDRGGPLLARIALPEPLVAHGDRLRRALGAAADDFDIGLDVAARLQGDDWSVEGRRPTLVQAASGLTLSIDPFAHQRWLQADPAGILLAGNVSLEGGSGVPSLDGSIMQLRLDETGTELSASELRLPGWTINGRTVSARFASLDLKQDDHLQAVVNGEVALSGSLPGLELDRVRLVGHVSAAQAREGWRVQTENESCIGFSSEGMRAGTIEFDPVALSLCPVDGRFVRQEAGASVGRIRLGDIRLPFHTEDMTGHVMMADAALEWFAGDGFRLFLKGDHFTAPLTFDERTLSVDSDNPQVVVALGAGLPSISVMLEQTAFGGTMVPANVSANAFSFNGVATDTGLDGHMSARRVRISDINDDPIYQPLIAELSATMAGGVVRLTGPISVEALGRQIADAQLDLDLAAFNGDGRIVMAPLGFGVGGIQPTDLSELFRGVLINTEGLMSGAADIMIRDGELSATGEVVLGDLIFDTFSAGRINGVNGRIVFDDMIGLTSAPGQEITIDAINPGIPLENGVATFQLIEGRQVALERIGWPLAGGEVAVQDTVWELGAENQEVTVAANSLELTRLVDVFKVPDIAASGTVSGTFPVNVEGANLWIRGARLVADEAGGKLSYLGTATDVLKGQNAYSDYALDALKDFYFTVMELGIDGNLIGNLVLKIDLLGQSPDVLDGAQFKFGFTLESHLAQLLRTFSNELDADFIIDTVREERAAAETEQ